MINKKIGVIVAIIVAITSFTAIYNTISSEGDPDSNVVDVANKIMRYISRNHPETHQFIDQMNWNVKKITNDIDGSKIYMLKSNGWTMTIKRITTQDVSYKIDVDYNSASISRYIGIPYRITWEGAYHNNNIVTEISYMFAQ
jgi:hypothetical protein